MRIVDIDQLESALKPLPENPRVVTSGSMSTPLPVLDALASFLPAWRLFIVNAPTGIPVGEHIQHETIFVGPGMRGNPNLAYYPVRLSLGTRLFHTHLPPDVVVLHCSRVVGDTVSMGIEVQVMRGALEAARRRGAQVIAMLNDHMPYTLGDAVVSTDDIDLAVQISAPLPSPGPSQIDDSSAVMGHAISQHIPDGAGIQVGIGAVPDAVLTHLTDRRRLRVWTELMTEGYFVLERAGALDADQPIVCTFMFGSQELYEFVDNNPRVRVLRCETTNDASQIAQQPSMVSVNTAMQVDLMGQVNATRIGTTIYSGYGGQPDFVFGAQMSPGGQAIIALKSWHQKADVSTIVPQLVSPATVRHPSVVVTEQGVAELFGRSTQEHAHQLIDNAAHPRARDDLRREARRMGLLPS